MNKLQSKRVLFVINSVKEKKALKDLSVMAKENKENIWVLFLESPPKRISLPLTAKLINCEDFICKEILKKKQKNIYDLVVDLKEKIKSVFPRAFEVEGISLLEICEVELHFYYIEKVLDQISLAKNIIDVLKINEVRIYGNFENFVSLRIPPFSTIFLWAFRIAGESININVKVFETRRKLTQFWFKLFLIWAPYLRVILQFIRYIKVFPRSRKGKWLKDKENKRIICLNHARPNAITLSPIIEKLKEGNWQPIILQVGKFGTEYFEKDFLVLPYEHSFNLRAFLLALKNLFSIIKNLKRLFASSLWIEKDLQKSAWGDFLKRLFVGFAVNRFSAALCYLIMSRESIRKFNPEIILLTQESNARERAMASVAKQHNCKTICVQCGLHGEDIYFKYKLFSDCYALESKQAKNSFIKLGYSENRFFVTGQPGYKWLKKKVKEIDKERVFQSLGINSKYPIIIYASQGYEEQLSSSKSTYTNAYAFYKKNLVKLYNELRLLLKEYNFWLIVKPHPKESKELHKMIFQQMHFDKAVLLSPEDDPYKVLGFCDLLISNYSTLAMEAIALGKPIIILEDDRSISTPFFKGCEAAFTIKSLRELKMAVEKVLYSNQKWSNKCYGFLEWQSGGPQEMVTERVIQLIKNLSDSN